MRHIDIRENTIIHGDSLTVLREMEPESVDAIITDPPYGINYVSQTGAKIPSIVVSYASEGDRTRSDELKKVKFVMNMIDNLSGPMAGVASKVGANVSALDAASQTFGGMAKAGAAMQEAGSQIVGAVLAPVEATFETRRALGELASLGVQDLGAIEDAARSFSDQWAGTSKADFISAAYDIKSGIASLTDEGVADYTELAGLTAKATKSTIGEMTSLFATGYGIYKDYYSDLSDLEFGEMFSAGIASSVKQFKTTGSGMAQAIQTLGASATTAQVPLEEQLSVLGMLQATMGGSEAGTKYKAFLRSATKGGEALGLTFTDANNQLLSMPEILDKLRGKFGETMDAAEKMELSFSSAFPGTVSTAPDGSSARKSRSTAQSTSAAL